jgi:hypothetical protein
MGDAFLAKLEALKQEYELDRAVQTSMGEDEFLDQVVKQEEYTRDELDGNMPACEQLYNLFLSANNLPLPETLAQMLKAVTEKNLIDGDDTPYCNFKLLAQSDFNDRLARYMFKGVIGSNGIFDKKYPTKGIVRVRGSG